MAYNIDHLSTAGKVTVLTMLLGIAVFIAIFLFNVPNTQVETVEAQSTATTTVRIVNTPPQWTVDAQEDPESSILYPTNAGDTVTWTAVATDSNEQDYYLLICMTSASPTPNTDAAPNCDLGTNQWAVSPPASSTATATAATTTSASWNEANDWYAWVCDADDETPRCVNFYRQGSGTTSSPFVVNHAPTFTFFADDSPAVPGTLVTFSTTATDTDFYGGGDTVQLHVCTTNSFDTVNDQCSATTTATSTFVSFDPTASYTIVIPTQDQDYDAYGFVIDNHGFEATGIAHGSSSVLTVANAAPYVASSSISLVQSSGTDMYLTVEQGETTGFELDFIVTDNNSCDAAGGGNADEVVDYWLSIYRSGVGSSTCHGAADNYDPNNCYPSELATTTWDLSCTASSTTCGGSMDPTVLFECTFPLWYIADPTDGTATSTQYNLQDWRAAVSAEDDNGATSTIFTESQTGVDVISFLAFNLNTIIIPYGNREPGETTDPLPTTTTMAATGNVGLDQRLSGQSMCPGYETGSPCPISSSSTIPDSNQRFGTTSLAWADATQLSSTTVQELEVNIFKSTSTSTPATGDTYWGISVPGTISVSGDYTGENTFIAIVGESADWD